MFVMHPVDTEATLPAQAQLTCGASGIPSPTYVWLRCEGNTEVQVELDSRVTEMNGTLTFNPSRREDAGMYKCVAENIYGNTTSQAVQITIFGKCLLLKCISMYVCMMVAVCLLCSSSPAS